MWIVASRYSWWRGTFPLVTIWKLQMDAQDQITLMSELDRISCIEDTQALRRMCTFLECFSEYLLSFFELPFDRIDEFCSWWNSPDAPPEHSKGCAAL